MAPSGEGRIGDGRDGSILQRHNRGSTEHNGRVSHSGTMEEFRIADAVIPHITHMLQGMAMIYRELPGTPSDFPYMAWQGRTE